MSDASDTYRHQCEVRQILVWRQERGREWAHDYINGRSERQPSGRVLVTRKGVRQARGDAAADLILADCGEQWRLGNDGRTPGLWLS